MAAEALAAPGPELVRAALSLSPFDVEAAWQAMMPESRRLYPAQRAEPPTPAAVLLLLYPRHNEWRFALTKRASDLRGHSGQISLPGGRIDDADADARAAALRETREELGIDTREVEWLGALTTVYIPPTHFLVQPQVGALPREPEWQPSAREVAALLSMSLTDLLDPGRKRQAMRRMRGRELRIPYYDVGGHQVWGATALMLSELEARLRQVLGNRQSLQPATVSAS